MNNNECFSLLKSLEISSELGGEEMEILSDLSEIITIQEGDFLIREGMVAHYMYIVADGRIDLYSPRKDEGELVFKAKASDIVGWSSLMPPRIYRADAVAFETSKLLKINGVDFLKKINQNSTTKYFFSKKLADSYMRRLSDYSEAVHL